MLTSTLTADRDFYDFLLTILLTVAELQSEHQRWSREEKKLNEKLLDLETEATQLRAQNEVLVFAIAS